MGGHFNLFVAGRFGQRFQIKRIWAGNNHQHRFAVGFVGQGNQGFEHLLRWHANCFSHFHRRMHTGCIVVGEHLISNALAV